MRRFVYLLLICMLLDVASYAQTAIVVSGTYTYYAPLTMSPVQAKAEAIQQAKLHLIANKFGTVVASSTVTNLANVNGQSSSFTSTFGESEVKGEWLETIGEPSFSQMEFLDNSLAVTVSIKGKIREITTSKTDISAKLLSNLSDHRSECCNFYDGQSFYLLFEAPVKGYLAVYLSDNETVFRLLPSRGSESGAFEVKPSTKYCFFDGKDTPEAVFKTSSNLEVNRMYVVFSGNQFTKGLDSTNENDESAVPVQKWDDFQKWLGKCRRQDKGMTVKAFDVTISKR